MVCKSGRKTCRWGRVDYPSHEEGVPMIGMDFISFLILLAISLIVSGVLHFGVQYYVTPGLNSYFGKVVIGWIGAWLGSPVLGHWWEGLNRGEVYYVPAFLGSLALLVIAVDAVNTCASICMPSKAPEQTRPKPM